MPSARSGRPIATIDLSAPAKAQVQLGQAITGFGKVIADYDESVNKFEAERKYQEFKWAEQQGLDQSMRDLPAGQAAGFADSWAGGYKERAKEFLAGVPDSLKSEYDNKLFSAEREFFGAAATYARGEQKRSAIASIDDMRNNVFNNRAASGEPIDKVRSDYKNLINANPFMSSPEKDELFRKTFSDLERTHIYERVRRGEDIEQIRKEIRGTQARTDTDVDTETRAKPISAAEKTDGHVELLKQLEGFSPRRYSDYKQNSIGYGTKAKPNELAITREEAEIRLREEADEVAAVVDKNLPGIDANKRAALISFGYNLGIGDGGLADLLPKAKEGKWDEVAKQMQKYVNAGGERNPGLVSRRQREGRLILGQEEVAGGAVSRETKFTGPYQQLSIDERRSIDEWLKGNQEAKTAQERSKLHQQLDDDVESIRDSGKSRVPDADVDRARKVLGEGVVGTYLTNRKQAYMEYTNLHDMDSLPDFDLEQRVADLVPKAGEADYAIKDAVLKKATQKKDQLIEERLHNPAAAVDKLPDLAEPLEVYRNNPDSPEAIQNLIRARLDAQAKLKIPSLQRQPITRDEATRIVRPALGLVGVERKKLVSVLDEMRGQLETTYGQYAPSVARSAIQIAVKDNEQSKRIEGIISRSWKGLPIRSSEIRELEALNEAAAARAAISQEANIPQGMATTATPQEQLPMRRSPAEAFPAYEGRSPVQVQSIEEALRLAPGTTFLDPNGNLRIR